MESVRLHQVVQYLERWVPPAYQESYDNSGLLTGDITWPVTGILTTLDCTEAVVEEAIALKCNVIVAHHPIIFKGLKKITGRNYVERSVIKAIKHDVAIYAIHTNLDHVHTGVNQMIAARLGLKNTRILMPKTGTLAKLVTFVPKSHEAQVVDTLHQAGAGEIGNYDYCSFRVGGTGYFRPNANAQPHTGKRNALEQVEEVRVEVIFPRHLQNTLLAALKKSHPYEEAAYYLTQLENENQEVGAGLIGELSEPWELIPFLERLKVVMNAKVVRHTTIPATKVSRVAVCGGAGSFLLPAARAAGADVLITADFKYHEFFDAEGKIMIADIGHYESEQFTKELLAKVLSEKFPTFAVNFSKIDTNPISYL